jgi:UDP-N-acetylglucosamine transferase subunit ALG13
MILVTVGTQLPFDRLVSAVDNWAGAQPCSEVFAQIGTTDLKPQHVKWAHQVPPGEFRQLFERADAIVAHAGIGTILAAQELQKPVLIMPRRAVLGEQRNDHQLATSRQFEKLGYVHVAWDEQDLVQKLDTLNQWRSRNRLDEQHTPGLVRRVREFIRIEKENWS